MDDLQLRTYRYLDSVRLYDYLSAFEPGQWTAETEVKKDENSSRPDVTPRFDTGTPNDSTVQQVSRERTITLADRHAFTRLYGVVSDRVQVIDEFTAVKFEELKKGQMLEITRSFSPSPAYTTIETVLQITDLMRTIGPTIGQAQDPESQAIFQALPVLFSGESGEGKNIPMVSELDSTGVTVLFNANDRYLLCSLDDFEGENTLLGTVQKLVPSNASIDLLELVRALPRSFRRSSGPAELRAAMVQMFEDMPSQYGGNLTEDSLKLTGPAIVVAPLACYTV